MQNTADREKLSGHEVGSALALFLEAFEGAPHPGTRELRLNAAERRSLRRLFPQAEFVPLEEGEGRCWYAVTLPQ